MGYKKVLVVYYSRTNITKLIAEEIKKSLDCDIEEIIDTKNRQGALQYALAGKDALQRKTTEIAPTKLNPKDYDLVIMGCPVWASHVVPALRTYINRYKDSFKNVAFFTTEISAGGDKVLSDMQNLCGISPVANMILTKKDMDSKNYLNSINEFLKDIK